MEMEMGSNNDLGKTSSHDTMINQENLENHIQSKGLEIFNLMESTQQKSIFNRDWWYGRIMEWSMKNDQFKTQMFRFVDVLPYLHNSSEVAKHLKEYFAEKSGELPSIFNFGVGMGSLAPGLLAGAVRKNVTQMAKMFITGEKPKDALPVLKRSRKNNMTFTVDLLGEATLSEVEAQDYHNRYMELIEWLSSDAKKWTENTLLDRDERGPIPKVNVSVKVTSLYSQINEKAWDETIQILKDRLRPIFKVAKENFVFINIDMEQFHHKDITLQVFQELLLEEEFKTYPHFGIVIQAYLRDSLTDLKELIEFAKMRGTEFTVRLVKGAYWDYELIEAQQKGWPIPVYTNKKESDYNYEICLREIFENYPHIRCAIASHNVRSIAAGIAIAEELKVPQQAVELQMLYGMADPIKKSMIELGFRVREYATVGELIPGMAYLVRRLLENTSNESFLRSKFADNISTEVLLANPAEDLEPSSENPKSHRPFENEPLLDFTVPQVRNEFQRALTDVQESFGKTHSLIIDNKEVNTEHQMESLNPSDGHQVLGQFHLASAVEGEKAIESCKKAYATWSKTPVNKRAQYLDQLAEKILENRYRLAALEVFEVGKNWSEADGDITEAIDFCRYYANEMRRLGRHSRVGHAPGEVSLFEYVPKGITAVIAPWNFPLAILTGMVSSAVVTGNTCIMKPAEQSTLVASELMKLILEVGFPPGVINFLPGVGEEIGEYLTQHKDIDIVSFTGSKQVGLSIFENAGQTNPAQKHVKKCIIEMGGKNALIIDSDADLDEAVGGVIYSAFGFQGQKCSACSRVIVHEGIYERFMDRLIEAAKSFDIGKTENPKTFMGPVIDKEAQQKILQMIEDAKSYGKLAFQGQVPTNGFFVPPTIFTEIKPSDKIAQEEIFGPVLAVIKAKSIDESIEIANGVIYGLTGGVYSRSPENIEKVKRQLEVGNLYINRGITGALVDRHPFGGFKMSGVGAKTGSSDYLQQFMDAKVVIENTMRRGFAPEYKDSDEN